MSLVKASLRFIVLLPVTIAIGYVGLLRHLRRSWAMRAQERFDACVDDSWVPVSHESADRVISMSFAAPNSLCNFRAETFSSKEPETLDWIDHFGGDGAFYDVGANIGLYSVYYCMRHSGTALAFEPSVFNLSLLARNVAANGVGDRVVIVPLPLTDQEQVSKFRLTSTEMGGALSSFGHDVGFDGKPLTSVFEYATLGVSLDYLVSQQLLPDPPRLLKIDVDGIEDLVVKGALEVLSSPHLVSILIELNDEVPKVTNSVTETLIAKGFNLRERRYGDLFEGTRFGAISNQIWVRDLV